MRMAGWMGWVLYSAMGAFAGDGGSKAVVPVELGIQRMNIKCIEPEKSSGQPLSDVRLSFDLSLSVPMPFDMTARDDLGEQSLEAMDSTGRKLGLVSFDMGRLHTWKKGAKKGTRIQGECPILPSPDAVWIRLKGTFRLPMTRDVESPVYDFSLAEGETSFPVSLAVPEEDYDGDLAVAGDAGMEELSAKAVGPRGKRLMLKFVLRSDREYRIASWELMDGDGKPLKTDFISEADVGTADRYGIAGWVTVDPGTDLSRLKIRLRYKENLDTVPIPVDIRMGLGGTVRE